MGRPPKALKGIPPSLEKLTDNQADLLAWVYWTGLGDTITWSAKAYLNRAATKSEAATLSKRVRGLVDQGVLDRSGRDVKLTQEGWVLLYNYALRNQHNFRMRALPVAMELERSGQDLDSFSNILTTATRCLDMGVITQPEFAALRSALEPLKRGIMGRQRSLRQALAEYRASERE